MIEPGQLIQVDVMAMKVIAIVLEVIYFDNQNRTIAFISIGTTHSGKLEIKPTNILSTNVKDREELHEKLKTTYRNSIFRPTHTSVEKTQ